MRPDACPKQFSAKQYKGQWLWKMWRWGCALALLCGALIDANAFKRAEMSATPFLLSSRYGRSPPRMLAPRNDRFFMSGRYGKRSETLDDGGIGFPFADTEKEREEERDKVRGKETDVHKWRPCNCDLYVKAMKNFYKRISELDSTEDE